MGWVLPAWVSIERSIGRHDRRAARACQAADGDVLALNVPQLTKSSLERFRSRCASSGKNPNSRHFGRLLRCGSERRREETTGDGTDERSPRDHWIIVSAA